LIWRVGPERFPKLFPGLVRLGQHDRRRDIVKARFTFSIDPADSGSTCTVAGGFDGALIKGAMAKALEKDGMKRLDRTFEQLEALASSADQA
jgi:hypothetical protein